MNLIDSIKGSVLILAPHTDDGELGCGGTIAKLVEHNISVYYIAFSTCEESVPEGFPSNILEIEVKKATKILGIKPENLFIENFQVRNFPENRQRILDTMIKYSKMLKPDMIFMPSSFDVHQDHNTIYQEGRRAFKNQTILGYEFMWNNYSFKTSAFCLLEEKHILKKIDAVAEYSSQKHRFYAHEKLIKGLANYRGLQLHNEFAESFEVIRVVFD